MQKCAAWGGSAAPIFARNPARAGPRPVCHGVLARCGPGRRCRQQLQFPSLKRRARSFLPGRQRRHVYVEGGSSRALTGCTRGSLPSPKLGSEYERARSARCVARSMFDATLRDRLAAALPVVSSECACDSDMLARIGRRPSRDPGQRRGRSGSADEFHEACSSLVRSERCRRGRCAMRSDLGCHTVARADSL